LLNIFGSLNNKIAKYILSNLVLIFFAIFFIISLIVFGNQFVLTAQEAIEYSIPIKDLMPLLSFNMLRDTPIILVISLFLSIIITFSQLYKNSEAIVLNSIGLGDKDFIRIIQPVTILLFIIVFILTVYIVPWAKQQKSNTEDITVNASEFSFITEGKFESFKNGDIVFYASEASLTSFESAQNMEGVFIYALDNDTSIVVLANEAVKYTDSVSKSTYLRLKDGVRYEGLPGDKNVNVLDFDLYDLEIISGDAQEALATFPKIEEKSTLVLIKEGGSVASAELQWRFSQPISILILSVMGVFLGRTSPRTGKGTNLLIGVIVYMIYNNALLAAKSAIENEQLSPFIGLWSVHIFFLVLIIFFYQFKEGKIPPINKKVILKTLQILIK
jgi:lipopolysaccharide export system permease protein